MVAKRLHKSEKIGHNNKVRRDKKTMTTEELEWAAYEEGHDEGYEAGVEDFAEVERRKRKLRARGLPVIGS